jgi:hypothetical protein
MVSFDELSDQHKLSGCNLRLDESRQGLYYFLVVHQSIHVPTPHHHTSAYTTRCNCHFFDHPHAESTCRLTRELRAAALRCTIKNIIGARAKMPLRMRSPAKLGGQRFQLRHCQLCRRPWLGVPPWRACAAYIVQAAESVYFAIGRCKILYAGLLNCGTLGSWLLRGDCNEQVIMGTWTKAAVSRQILDECCPCHQNGLLSFDKSNEVHEKDRLSFRFSLSAMQPHFFQKSCALRRIR